MTIRIDCTIEGHDGEWVEYGTIRYKHRRRYMQSNDEDEIWATVCDCLQRWSITDADGNGLPGITPDTVLDDLEELEDPMMTWLIGSFAEALIEGRRRAQTAPFSDKSP